MSKQVRVKGINSILSQHWKEHVLHKVGDHVWVKTCTTDVLQDIKGAV